MQSLISEKTFAHIAVPPSETNLIRVLSSRELITHRSADAGAGVPTGHAGRKGKALQQPLATGFQKTTFVSPAGGHSLGDGSDGEVGVFIL